MEAEDQTHYARLRSLLVIDLTRLDDALMNLPMDQMDIAEFTAAASSTKDAAKFNLERVTADCAANLRKANKISEAQIKSEVALFDEVAAAQEAFREAEYDYDLWKGLSDATRAKSSSLNGITDLIKAGYMTTSTIYENRRNEIDAYRQQVNAARQSR